MKTNTFGRPVRSQNKYANNTSLQKHTIQVLPKLVLIGATGNLTRRDVIISSDIGYSWLFCRLNLWFCGSKKYPCDSCDQGQIRDFDRRSEHPPPPDHILRPPLRDPTEFVILSCILSVTISINHSNKLSVDKCDIQIPHDNSKTPRLNRSTFTQLSVM